MEREREGELWNWVYTVSKTWKLFHTSIMRQKFHFIQQWTIHQSHEMLWPAYETTKLKLSIQSCFIHQHKTLKSFGTLGNNIIELPTGTGLRSADASKETKPNNKAYSGVVKESLQLKVTKRTRLPHVVKPWLQSPLLNGPHRWHMHITNTEVT